MLLERRNQGEILEKKYVRIMKKRDAATAVILSLGKGRGQVAWGCKTPCLPEMMRQVTTWNAGDSALTVAGFCSFPTLKAACDDVLGRGMHRNPKRQPSTGTEDKISSSTSC